MTSLFPDIWFAKMDLSFGNAQNVDHISQCHPEFFPNFPEKPDSDLAFLVGHNGKRLVLVADSMMKSIRLMQFYGFAFSTQLNKGM